MRIVRSLYLIINYKTFLVTALSLVSTWLCTKYNYKADFPLTLVGIAIVFPVVFSIDSAYKRRERALMLLADLEAHLVALNMAAKDWLRNMDNDFLTAYRQRLLAVYAAIKNFFLQKESSAEGEKKISLAMSKLSEATQQLRDYNLPAGEMSRVNQYLSKILIDIENLKTIFYYRTPVTLRSYSRVFIYAFPIIYGPYFVYIAESFSPGLEYAMPVIFSFILVSLDNIQVHLENPFDQLGEDDIKFDQEKFARLLD